MYEEFSVEREIEVFTNSDPLDLPRPDPIPNTPRPGTSLQEIHANVFKLSGGLFAGILMMFLLTFSSDGETVFMIAVCAVYGLMYFGGGALLYRMRSDRREAEEFSTFLDDSVRTFTGDMKGWEAMVQVCLIPAALFVCVAGICLAIVAAG